MGVLGQVISGDFGKILIRQKSGLNIELGELLIADTKQGKILMQVYDLIYGSQISQSNLELISGLMLEESQELGFMEPELRNYNLALAKSLVVIENKNARVCKVLPNFFSEVREITKDDIIFLSKPKNPLFVGKLRSGSKVLDVDINLEGEPVFRHHILVPATTGRGKSNLVKVMCWNIMDKGFAGVLVLDPHDEYYGRNKPGLKDHPSKNLVYYTPKNAPPGCKTLKINIKTIRPGHFNGVVDWSGPQREALDAYYKMFGEDWIKAILAERKLDVDFFETTIGVVKRRLLSLLDLKIANNQIVCDGVFDFKSGETTIKEICEELESGKIVIVDTSHFSGSVEILIGSLIVTEMFNKYRHYKAEGSLDQKPVISIVLEEAPRVLGKEVLEKGSNIFSTIAREGRKFKIGLLAITQLPSLIPRQILANMNTKIILGLEMAPERQAIIESASQDLSQDNRTIAALDVGEALITSNFTKFATPIKVPLFENLIKDKSVKQPKKDFSGVLQ